MLSSVELTRYAHSKLDFVLFYTYILRMLLLTDASRGSTLFEGPGKRQRASHLLFKICCYLQLYVLCYLHVLFLCSAFLFSPSCFFIWPPFSVVMPVQVIYASVGGAVIHMVNHIRMQPSVSAYEH